MSAGRRRYDWEAIRTFYESGHTVAECQARFGFSAGAWDAAMRRGDVVTGARSKPRGRTRAAVAKLVEADLSVAKIARELSISKPTVCFHMRMLGIPPREDFARRYDWAAIRAAYDEGASMTDCMRRFGFSRNA